MLLRKAAVKLSIAVLTGRAIFPQLLQKLLKSNCWVGSLRTEHREMCAEELVEIVTRLDTFTYGGIIFRRVVAMRDAQDFRSLAAVNKNKGVSACPLRYIDTPPFHICAASKQENRKSKKPGKNYLFSRFSSLLSL
jgi:hypothetical protein